ncbi:hypothetical protein BESB_083070 [Besnoitia besnoiti]|uniref:Uncharacterized protein n=1 Tax=Besnoitia besnoiti TaxID=94643 RepID=A0A2A9M3P6_BESBE|nr:hypothetical protein BESB_083070 [Besnoitia besnoiti]PFH33108.1 hypothetical protein BESB_083070 [Besnoitia besnoiti]
MQFAHGCYAAKEARVLSSPVLEGPSSSTRGSRSDERLTPSCRGLPSSPPRGVVMAHGPERSSASCPVFCPCVSPFFTSVVPSSPSLASTGERGGGIADPPKRGAFAAQASPESLRLSAADRPPGAAPFPAPQQSTNYLFQAPQTEPQLHAQTPSPGASWAPNPPGSASVGGASCGPQGPPFVQYSLSSVDGSPGCLASAPEALPVSLASGVSVGSTTTGGGALGNGGVDRHPDRAGRQCPSQGDASAVPASLESSGGLPPSFSPFLSAPVYPFLPPQQLPLVVAPAVYGQPMRGAVAYDILQADSAYWALLSSQSQALFPASYAVLSAGKPGEQPGTGFFPPSGCEGSGDPSAFAGGDPRSSASQPLCTQKLPVASSFEGQGAFEGTGTSAEGVSAFYAPLAAHCPQQAVFHLVCGCGERGPKAHGGAAGKDGAGEQDGRLTVTPCAITTTAGELGEDESPFAETGAHLYGDKGEWNRGGGQQRQDPSNPSSPALCSFLSGPPVSSLSTASSGSAEDLVRVVAEGDRCGAKPGAPGDSGRGAEGHGPRREQPARNSQGPAAWPEPPGASAAPEGDGLLVRGRQQGRATGLAEGISGGSLEEPRSPGVVAALYREGEGIQGSLSPEETPGVGVTPTSSLDRDSPEQSRVSSCPVSLCEGAEDAHVCGREGGMRGGDGPDGSLSGPLGDRAACEENPKGGAGDASGPSAYPAQQTALPSFSPGLDGGGRYFLPNGVDLSVPEPPVLPAANSFAATPSPSSFASQASSPFVYPGVGAGSPAFSAAYPPFVAFLYPSFAPVAYPPGAPLDFAGASTYGPFECHGTMPSAFSGVSYYNLSALPFAYSPCDPAPEAISAGLAGASGGAFSLASPPYYGSGAAPPAAPVSAESYGTLPVAETAAGGVCVQEASEFALSAGAPESGSPPCVRPLQELTPLLEGIAEAGERDDSLESECDDGGSETSRESAHNAEEIPQRGAGEDASRTVTAEGEHATAATLGPAAGVTSTRAGPEAATPGSEYPVAAAAPADSEPAAPASSLAWAASSEPVAGPGDAAETRRGARSPVYRGLQTGAAGSSSPSASADATLGAWPGPSRAPASLESVSRECAAGIPALPLSRDRGDRCLFQGPAADPNARAAPLDSGARFERPAQAGWLRRGSGAERRAVAQFGSTPSGPDGRMRKDTRDRGRGSSLASRRGREAHFARDRSGRGSFGSFSSMSSAGSGPPFGPRRASFTPLSHEGERQRDRRAPQSRREPKGRYVPVLAARSRAGEAEGGGDARETTRDARPNPGEETLAGEGRQAETNGPTRAERGESGCTEWKEKRGDPGADALDSRRAGAPPDEALLAPADSKGCSPTSGPRRSASPVASRPLAAPVERHPAGAAENQGARGSLGADTGETLGPQSFAGSPPSFTQASSSLPVVAVAPPSLLAPPAGDPPGPSAAPSGPSASAPLSSPSASSAPPPLPVAARTPPAEGASPPAVYSENSVGGGAALVHPPLQSCSGALRSPSSGSAAREAERGPRGPLGPEAQKGARPGDPAQGAREAAQANAKQDKPAHLRWSSWDSDASGWSSLGALNSQALVAGSTQELGPGARKQEPDGLPVAPPPPLQSLPRPASSEAFAGKDGERGPFGRPRGGGGGEGSWPVTRGDVSVSSSASHQRGKRENEAARDAPRAGEAKPEKLPLEQEARARRDKQKEQEVCGFQSKGKAGKNGKGWREISQGPGPVVPCAPAERGAGEAKETARRAAPRERNFFSAASQGSVGVSQTRRQGDEGAQASRAEERERDGERNGGAKGRSGEDSSTEARQSEASSSFSASRTGAVEKTARWRATAEAAAGGSARGVSTGSLNSQRDQATGRSARDARKQATDGEQRRTAPVAASSGGRTPQGGGERPETSRGEETKKIRYRFVESERGKAQPLGEPERAALKGEGVRRGEDAEGAEIAAVPPSRQKEETAREKPRPFEKRRNIMFPLLSRAVGEACKDATRGGRRRQKRSSGVSLSSSLASSPVSSFSSSASSSCFSSAVSAASLCASSASSSRAFSATSPLSSFASISSLPSDISFHSASSKSSSLSSSSSSSSTSSLAFSFPSASSPSAVSLPASAPLAASASASASASARGDGPRGAACPVAARVLNDAYHSSCASARRSSQPKGVASSSSAPSAFSAWSLSTSSLSASSLSTSSLAPASTLPASSHSSSLSSSSSSLSEKAEAERPGAGSGSLRREAEEDGESRRRRDAACERGKREAAHSRHPRVAHPERRRDEEKEKALDEKMATIREQNRLLEKRHRQVRGSSAKSRSHQRSTSLCGLCGRKKDSAMKASRSCVHTYAYIDRNR